LLIVAARQQEFLAVLHRLKSLGPLFHLTVVLPTLLAALYFGLLASDVYISESRFVVRSPGQTSASPLGMILSAGGFASASEENYAVVDYVQSRDALIETNRDGFVGKIYSRPEISVFDRFGGLLGGSSLEHLYRYFEGKVDIEFDTATQVTKLMVSAYTPGEAQQLNERLLERSEALVNQLSERRRRDAITAAQATVDESRTLARNAVVALARFRDKNGVIDPERQAQISLQMISKLQDALVAEQAQLAQLRAVTPQNPQIPAVKTRIGTLQREIESQSSRVAGAPRSLSATASQYQQLMFDAEFASKQLAVAMASLQEAQNDARKKQVYLERIAAPNLPDYPLEPRRWRYVFATLLIGLLVWGIASTLLAGIREHRD
jgi:BexC/CtrB/KpsE family polysaccharide export inner-membrane protein